MGTPPALPLGRPAFSIEVLSGGQADYPPMFPRRDFLKRASALAAGVGCLRDWARMMAAEGRPLEVPAGPARPAGSNRRCRSVRHVRSEDA